MTNSIESLEGVTNSEGRPDVYAEYEKSKADEKEEINEGLKYEAEVMSSLINNLHEKYPFVPQTIAEEEPCYVVGKDIGLESQNNFFVIDKNGVYVIHLSNFTSENALKKEHLLTKLRQEYTKPESGYADDTGKDYFLEADKAYESFVDKRGASKNEEENVIYSDDMYDKAYAHKFFVKEGLARLETIDKIFAAKQKQLEATI